MISWQAFLALVLGGLYGSIFGAIPGLTATLAVALFIPLAFFLDPIIALPAIIAISSVAIYAGDVGSAVARIPGTPASAAYVEELYDVSSKRGPLYGLGISALGSAAGGIAATVVLVLGATALAEIATHFSSFEYFWVAVLGLTAGVFAARKSPVKGMVSLLLGLFLSTFGVDPTLGYPRFDFGSATLLGGLDYVVALIGLFGFSEVLEHLSRGRGRAGPGSAGQPSGSFFSGPLRLIRQSRLLVARSSAVGTLVGLLPGAGADVAAWVATSYQKLKERSAERTVLSGASSNNAAVASAWIPALSLGLPGDTVTAMVLAVFLMKGITPGPLLFETNPALVISLFGTFLLSNLLLLPVFGYLSARLAALALRVPLRVLLSAITGICIIGAYALHNNPVDVWIMAAMGVLAFLLRRGGFPLAQVVLGMVLGPILEQHFMVSAIKSSWDLASFVQRPIAILLVALTVLTVYLGIRAGRVKR